MPLNSLLIDTIRSMTTLKMMTQGQTLEVARHESDEKMSPPLEVSLHSAVRMLSIYF